MFAMYELQGIIDQALAEDIGTGDLSAQIIAPGVIGQAHLYAKQEGVVAGLELAQQVFQRVDSGIKVQILQQDGAKVMPGTVVMELQGSLSSILQAERVALNFLQHLSGIATATAQVVELVKDLPVSVTDTRKTLPGLRKLQKYAVRVGGGRNHRFGLYDAVMLKDNHLSAVGGLSKAVELAREAVGHMVKIEVECETIEQVKEAVACGVDVIMLDNMSVLEMREAVNYVNQRAIVEASGGITKEGLYEVAATGVDVISLGALTHSVKALDFSLDVGEIKNTTRQRWQRGIGNGL